MENREEPQLFLVRGCQRARIAPRLGAQLGADCPGHVTLASTSSTVTWEWDLVGPRFHWLSPNHRSLGFPIVFTAVQLFLLSQGTDRQTPNHGTENNTLV